MNFLSDEKRAAVEKILNALPYIAAPFAKNKARANALIQQMELTQRQNAEADRQTERQGMMDEMARELHGMKMRNAERTEREAAARAWLFTDPKSLRLYPNFFRSTLVGLVGSAHRTGLSGPVGSDLYTVLCPAVEVFEYPSLPVYWIRRSGWDSFLEALDRFKPTVLHGIWPRHGRHE